MDRRPRRCTSTCAALVVAVSMLVAVGCGESDDGARSLSKREYIERVDALQQDAAGKLDPDASGRLPATPASASPRLAALDELIEAQSRLVPPVEWRDEHARLVDALRTMRDSLAIVSRASAHNRGAIAYQTSRYADAQAAYADAVDDINASR